jgi:hypothetical protein
MIRINRIKPNHKIVSNIEIKTFIQTGDVLNVGHELFEAFNFQHVEKLQVVRVQVSIAHYFLERINKKTLLIKQACQANRFDAYMSIISQQI